MFVTQSGINTFFFKLLMIIYTYNNRRLLVFDTQSGIKKLFS